MSDILYPRSGDTGLEFFVRVEGEERVFAIDFQRTIEITNFMLADAARRLHESQDIKDHMERWDGR